MSKIHKKLQRVFVQFVHFTTCAAKEYNKARKRVIFILSDAKKASNAKWDSQNMAYQTVKVNKNLLKEFKEACARRGDRVNTVLREAMEDYIKRDDESRGE